MLFSEVLSCKHRTYSSLYGRQNFKSQCMYTKKQGQLLKVNPVLMTICRAPLTQPEQPEQPQPASECRFQQHRRDVYPV